MGYCLALLSATHTRVIISLWSQPDHLSLLGTLSHHLGHPQTKIGSGLPRAENRSMALLCPLGGRSPATYHRLLHHVTLLTPHLELTFSASVPPTP